MLMLEDELLLLLLLLSSLHRWANMRLGLSDTRLSFVSPWDVY